MILYYVRVDVIIIADADALVYLFVVGEVASVVVMAESSIKFYSCLGVGIKFPLF